MGVRQVLVAARELISEPERWTKVEIARNAEGNPTVASYRDAACWCLMGAVSRCSPYGSSVYMGALLALRSVLDDDGDTVLVDFNDHPDRTHGEVLALLDRAIEAAPE